MDPEYQVGQTVLVRLPNYTIHRRATINKYNKKSGVFNVILAKTGIAHDIDISMIKAYQESKSPKQNGALELNVNDVQLSSISAETTQKPRRGRPRRHPNLLLQHESLVDLSVTEFKTQEPIVSINGPRKIVLPYWSYFSLKFFLYISFGFAIMSILNACLERSCALNDLNLYSSFIPKMPSYIELYMSAFPAFTLLASHFLIYFAIYKSGHKSFCAESLLPVILGLAIYGAKKIHIYEFRAIFDHMQLFIFVYLIFCFLFLSFSPVYRYCFNDSFEFMVFFEQHSILLMMIALVHQTLHMHYIYVENFSFYYLFFSGYVAIQCLRIHYSNRPRRVNFLSLLFARPFLLTFPILNAISKISQRWHIICYLPIFLTYMACFIKQVEPKASEPEASRFFDDFRLSLMKISMAALS
ncbi:hypothetical protein HZS_4884, partial [Henneguya salminicola]